MPTSKVWRRCKGRIQWGTVNGSFQVTWNHSFNLQADEEIYFAFAYPYSTIDVENKLIQVEELCKANNYYFHWDILIKSLEGWNVDIITISDKDSQTSDYEAPPEGIFLETKEKPILFKDRKKYVFLSARVHPGETPSSFVLNGLLDLILTSKKQGSTLLKNYVFKIIPILNPDGVSWGYYRLDTAG